MASFSKTRGGILYGIGVGPGDPELLTIKALRLIKECEVLAYPAPEAGEGMAFEIVRSFIKPGAEVLPIRIPIETSPFPAQEAYDNASKMLEKLLQSGKSIALICLGDPFFYGSFMYMFERLSIRYKIEIVPGVSAPMACAAALKTPLVSRNEVLTILPGPMKEEKLEEKLSSSDSAIIIKVGNHLPKIRRVLRHLRLEKFAKYVEYATMPNQQIFPIESIESQKAPYFSMILIRKKNTQISLGLK